MNELRELAYECDTIESKATTHFYITSEHFTFETANHSSFSILHIVFFYLSAIRIVRTAALRLPLLLRFQPISVVMMSTFHDSRPLIEEAFRTPLDSLGCLLDDAAAVI